MKFSAATISAVAALLPSLASAHLFMSSPPPFRGNDGKDNFPLNDDGSNYPCGVNNFDEPGNVPTFEPGSQQSISLQGSAVHGGGSCQISFTYDTKPSKGSVFRVVKSFQGNCPVQADGNLTPNPDNSLPPLPFQVPDDMPAGPAVVAWTWFNKIGNREMYMRCARVNIGGSNQDKSKFEQLPEILKANIGNGCSTKEGDQINFPNPGPQVQGTGSGSPVGNCGPSGPAPPSQPPTEVQPPADAPVLVEPPKEPPKDTPPPPPPASGSCQDGAIVCTGTTSFAICSFGKLVPMGQTAAGVQCRDGQMVAAKIKRSVRFSVDHMRRSSL